MHLGSRLCSRCSRLNYLLPATSFERTNTDHFRYAYAVRMNAFPRYSAAARQADQASTSSRSHSTDSGRPLPNFHQPLSRNAHYVQSTLSRGGQRGLRAVQSHASQGATSVPRPGVQEQSTESLEPDAAMTVPRKRGVTDGVWDKRDDEAMKEALADKAKGKGIRSGEKRCL